MLAGISELSLASVEGLSILDPTTVDVLDRQSLGDRFQAPIFFSTIAIVSLDIQSVFGP